MSEKENGFRRALRWRRETSTPRAPKPSFGKSYMETTGSARNSEKLAQNTCFPTALVFRQLFPPSSRTRESRVFPPRNWFGGRRRRAEGRNLANGLRTAHRSMWESGLVLMAKVYWQA